MHGLVFGFPKCVAFVYGTKRKPYRPKDVEVQEDRFDGEHHTHFFALLKWTDVFGLIVILDFTLDWSSHAQSIFNQCAPFRHPLHCFTDGDVAIADTGFQEEGNIITPFKINQTQNFKLVSNLFSLFLGRWYFKEIIFPTFYTFAANLANLRIRRNGVVSVPMERMLERLQLYEDEL